MDTNAVTRTTGGKSGGAKSGAAVVLASSVLSDNGSVDDKRTNDTNPLNLGYALIAAAAVIAFAVT